jgi:hypothetical protein
MKKKAKMKLKMDFISSTSLDTMTGEKKINFILNKVKDGSILVVNGVLTPDEEMDLIKETMRRVDDGFPGIEVCSLKKRMKGWKQFFESLSNGREKLSETLLSGITGQPVKAKLKTGMTLIGPARLIKGIKKNPDSFSITAQM